MKKKITALLISIAMTGVFAAETDLKINIPENITPASSDFFLKTNNLQKTLKIINILISTFQIYEPFRKFKTIAANIKKKTGIDILNENSFKKIGIDTGKSICISSSTIKAKKEPILFIPVSDKKNFPLTFIKLLKIIDGENQVDLNPIVSEYQNYRISQVLSDIFFTMIDDYFVITSDADLLKKVIDLKTVPGSTSLNDDPSYQDYILKKNICDIDVFAKKNFLIRSQSQEIATIPAAPKDADDAEKIPGPDAEENRTEVITGEITEGNTADEKTESSSANSYADCINYLGFGLKYDPKEIVFEISMSADTKEPDTDRLTKIFTTGLKEKTLFNENPISYHFLSLNIKALNEYLKVISEKDENVKQYYSGMKELLKNTLDLNLDDDTLECFGNMINIVMQKSETPGTMDKYIMFIQMRECSNSGDIWDGLKNYINKRYMNQSGEENSENYKSLWFTDEKGKTYIVLNSNNYYMGNDIELIKTVIADKNKNLTNIKNSCIGLVDNDTFLFSYTRFDNESFLKAVVTMLFLQINPGLYTITNKIDSISLTGKKNANYFSIDLNIKMH